MDIGCLECGEESKVIGLYERIQDAKRVKAKYTNPSIKWGRPEWRGQHSIEIFEIEI